MQDTLTVSICLENVGQASKEKLEGHRFVVFVEEQGKQLVENGRAKAAHNPSAGRLIGKAEQGITKVVQEAEPDAAAIVIADREKVGGDVIANRRSIAKQSGVLLVAVNNGDAQLADESDGHRVDFLVVRVLGNLTC